MVLGRVLSAAIGLTPDGPHLSPFGLRPRFKRGLRQKLRPRLKRGLRYGFRPRVKRGHRPDPKWASSQPFVLKPRFKRGLRHKLRPRLKRGHSADSSMEILIFGRV